MRRVQGTQERHEVCFGKRLRSRNLGRVSFSTYELEKTSIFSNLKFLMNILKCNKNEEEK